MLGTEVFRLLFICGQIVVLVAIVVTIVIFASSIAPILVLSVHCMVSSQIWLSARLHGRGEIVIFIEFTSLGFTQWRIDRFLFVNYRRVKFYYRRSII